MPELVDAENGWLIHAGSVEALAEAMQAALHAPHDRLREMGQVGQLRVRSMHDPDINAQHLASLLVPLL